MDRFQDLMNGYLQQSLSQDERLEFFQLLAEKKDMDIDLPDELIKKLAKERDFDLILSDSYDDNYVKIRSTLDLSSEEHPVPTESPSQGKIIHVRWTHTWYTRAAAIIIIAMAAGVLILSKGAKFFNPFSTEQVVQLARFQGKQLVDLPDGSKVVLNENSELNFNGNIFGKDAREVNLIGEATFDVAHDPSKPFVVHTGKVSTKVLGTEFNVRAYPEQEKITVTVLRGLVEVGDGQRVYAQIRPNEQIAVDVSSNQFTQLATNAEESVQWKSNFLILKDVTMDAAAVMIGEKFKTNVLITNGALRKCKISASFVNGESIEQVIKVISSLLEATYSVDKNEVRIEGGRSCE